LCPPGLVRLCRVCGALASSQTLQTPSRCARTKILQTRPHGGVVACQARQEPPGPVGGRPGVAAHLPHIQPSLQHLSHICNNNVAKHTHSRPRAKSTLLTGPGPTTEPWRYPCVAMVPRPALVPGCARLCRFPGRDAAFRTQRGLCRGDHDGVSLLGGEHRCFVTHARSEIVVHGPLRPHSDMFPLRRPGRARKRR